MKSQNKSRDILLIFFLVLAALLYRRFDAFTHSQLWAEDYAIYFLQNEDMGIKALFTPYGGYLHFVPRLLAMFFGFLHIDYLYIPICYDYSAFLFAFFIALNIWKTSAYLNIKHRIIYAVAFLYLPLGSDIYMNYVNINWIGALYLINFLFTRYTDHTEKPKILNLVIILIISLSAPFSTLLSPIIVLILILERKELSYRKIIPLALILLGGTIQLICMKYIDPNFYRGVPGEPEHYHIIKLFTNNMNEVLFFTKPYMQWMSPFKMAAISMLVFLALLGAFIVNYIKLANKRKYILLLFALIAFASYVKAYWPNESRVLALDNPRYYFLPFICIAWLMIIRFDDKIKSWHVCIYLLFFAAQHQYICMRLPDKQWKQQIHEFYDGTRNEIQINPEGWHFPTPKNNPHKKS